MSHLEQEKQEQKNMMVALVLVIGVFMAFNWFSTKKEMMAEVPLDPNVLQNQPETLSPREEEASLKVADVQTENESKSISFPDISIPMANDAVSGSFQVAGTRFNALSLLKYRVSPEKEDDFVALLDNNFQADLKWIGSEKYFPDMSVPPQVQGDKLTPFSPVVLTWKNDFVTVERTLTLDEAYMIQISDKIVNHMATAMDISLSGRILRQENSIPEKATAVHEGFLGFFDNREVEERYKSIDEEDPFVKTNKGGWIGITDKYWQTIFIPDQKTTLQMSFAKDKDLYVSSFQSDKETILPGKTLLRTTKLFAGAKELHLLNEYTEKGVPRLDLSIDFGWYYFLTKPFLYFLGFLYSLVGNMGIAILIFATLLRILMLPIAGKSYKSMAEMKKIQPKLQALQERFKDNRQQLQIEMMKLYRTNGVSPASGCLPLLIQIPVFFALYKVLSVSILMRQAPFFGWIQDLSMPDPSSVFTAFGYLSWPIPHVLDIGILPVIMGLTMFIQQRLNPSPTKDENQKIIMNLMPVIFTFMLGNFASGLVIYWTWSNIFSLFQQRYIMKKYGV